MGTSLHITCERSVAGAHITWELTKDRKRGRDGTRYSRFHPSNFLSHHLSKIVTAAVYADAQHIEDEIYGLKQSAHALADPAAGAA